MQTICLKLMGNCSCLWQTWIVKLPKSQGLPKHVGLFLFCPQNENFQQTDDDQHWKPLISTAWGDNVVAPAFELATFLEIWFVVPNSWAIDNIIVIFRTYCNEDTVPCFEPYFAGIFHRYLQWRFLKWLAIRFPTPSEAAEKPSIRVPKDKSSNGHRYAGQGRSKQV